MICLASKNMRSCVREDMLDYWDAHQHEYFADPSDPVSKRTPGLWKGECLTKNSKLESILSNVSVEAEGDRMVLISSKVLYLLLVNHSN